MATAKEIADERLARGEISVNEHKEILKNIGIETTSSAPVSLDNVNQKKKIIWNLIQIAVSAVVILYAWNYFSARLGTSGGGKFNIGNINSTGAGGVLSFTIANPNNRSDDVVIYVTQDGSRMCEHIAKMDANTSYNLRFRCAPMGLGNFQINAAWASFRPEIANIAQRF